MIDELDDFAEGDPFDPDQIDAQDTKKYETKEAQERAQRAHVEARMIAYREVFSVGPTTQAALDKVLEDLALFARAQSDTFHPDPYIHAHASGRRAVYTRIMKTLHVPLDEQFTAYVRSIHKFSNMKD